MEWERFDQVPGDINGLYELTKNTKVFSNNVSFKHRKYFLLRSWFSIGKCSIIKYCRKMISIEKFEKPCLGYARRRVA